MNIKYGLFSKYLFQRAQQHGGYTKLYVTISLYKKECLPVITRNKKHSSKQVVSMIYTLGKDFFATATFQGYRDVSFQTVKKLVVYFGLCESSLHFYRTENQIDSVYAKKT